jgi:hypothetical protein
MKTHIKSCKEKKFSRKKEKEEKKLKSFHFPHKHFYGSEEIRRSKKNWKESVSRKEI